jgi:hypothetical protein
MGRLDAEMGSRLLLDPEGRPAPVLKDLDEALRFCRRRQPEPGARRDDHIFLAPDEHRAAIRPRGDDVARLKRGASNRGGGAAAMLHLDRPGRLGDPPQRALRKGGVAPEEQHQDEGAHEHRKVTFHSSRKGPGGSAFKVESLRAPEGAWLKTR